MALEDRRQFEQPLGLQYIVGVAGAVMAGRTVLSVQRGLCAGANPGYDDCWAPALGADDMAALRAKGYVMFGVIRPTPAQWRRAHAALFGSLLYETCG